MDYPEFSRELLECMTSANRVGASELIEQLIKKGVSPKEIVDDVLFPTQVKIGELWETERVSLAQSYVAAKIAEDILLLCLPLFDLEQWGTKGSVVLGNIEEDYHSVGRRIVAAYLTSASWQVHDLGGDVPPQDFIDKALETGSSIIGASAMMRSTALNIRKLRDLIDEQGLKDKLMLAVGGAVFNWRPELVDEVGGDGTAQNASGVDKLCTDLLARASSGGGK